MSEGRGYLVTSFDAVAVQQALLHIAMVDSSKLPWYDNGKLYVALDTEHNVQHYDKYALRPATAKELAVWARKSKNGRKQLVYTTNTAELSLDTLYNTERGLGVATHIQVLAHPHAKYVSVPQGLWDVGVRTVEMLAEARELHDNDVNGGLLTRDALSAVTIAAEEIIARLESLDNRGLKLGAEEAPDLHKVLNSCVDRLALHFAELKKQELVSRQAHVAHLANSVGDLEQTMNAILSTSVLPQETP